MNNSNQVVKKLNIYKINNKEFKDTIKYTTAAFTVLKK